MPANHEIGKPVHALSRREDIGSPADLLDERLAGGGIAEGAQSFADPGAKRIYLMGWHYSGRLAALYVEPDVPVEVGPEGERLSLVPLHAAGGPPGHDAIFEHFRYCIGESAAE
jgi:hypothetical protein